VSSVTTNRPVRATAVPGAGERDARGEAATAADDGIAVFVRRHQTWLWRFLRVLGCRGQQAEAIVQDALVIALQRGLAGAAIADAPVDDAAVRAFLRQTGKHLWLREQRADRRRAERHAAAGERSMAARPALQLVELGSASAARR
jgi:DNA-directed RNA polymerase specialized sigma24 family protein